MGNQLSGIAPSQIYPVEHYLTDHKELKFDVSLGSTRFFKVARAESQEGLIVVKVFAIHDVSLPLQPHKDRIADINKRLLAATNCLPFRNIVVTEKAALIMREYVKSSLYDRISTRPFLSNIEKLWITFQVLCALHQCHKVGVCHGDIKLENITVTSWNWVLLVDFASFKPTFLPEDNPADFSYFFDTSRRRTCYIAPERFVTSSSDANAGLSLGETDCNSNELKPAMDIFSAGCALIEFWNEGIPPFDLSQLLAYRSGEYDPSHHLEKIENPELRALLSNMIERDPSKRQSAELYLAQERYKLFPDYFYKFLLLYMQMFSATPILFTDEKVLRLKKDISTILRDTLENCNEKEDENDGRILIVSLVTSCVRGLHECTPKLELLEILLELAENVSDEIILDRILPYLLHFVQDANAMVKVSTIQVITKCLDLIKHIPKSNSNIFSDYILPELSPLANDPHTSVRAAYARNIGSLAQISMRYLKQTKIDTCIEITPTNSGDDDDENENDKATRNYHMELQSLRDMIERTVSPLLVDSDVIVKQTLLQCAIDKLCQFFGKHKTNDLILTHIITFLNENNKELRGSFFDCIVGVASFIGSGCSSVITPLLVQGLTDSSEFVIAKSIDAMTKLTEANIFYKNNLCELIKESSCFLIHPNLWIRMALAGFISLASTKLSTVDVQCKIMPNITMYMKHELIQIHRAELLLDSLSEPISRQIYDDILSYKNIDDVFACLKDRQKIRVHTKEILSSSTEMQHSLMSLFRRITAEGMTDAMEEYLLIMENHLRKIHRHKIGHELPEEQRPVGYIAIAPNVPRQVFNLNDNRLTDLQGRNLHRIAALAVASSTDWNVVSPETLLHSSSASRSLSRPTTPPSMDRGLVNDRSFIEYRRSNCSKHLNQILNKQQDRYSQTIQSREWKEMTTWQTQLPPPGWKLRGTLVAHLHEHRAPITKLAPLNESSMFVSASRDGYIRIWELQKMEGKNIANRSKQSYKMAGGSPIISMAVCEQGQSIAAAAEDGSISIIRLEAASSRMSLVHAKQLNEGDEVYALDMQYVDAGPQSLLVYTTLNGKIFGWDLRSPTPAYTLTNSLKNGISTTLCVEPQDNWLVVGTSSGCIIGWDLRFQIPIVDFKYPHGYRLRKIVKHPVNPSGIITSVQGSTEVSVWDLESSSRQMVLWSSKHPPLTNNDTNGGVFALQSGCIDRLPYVITGGTDQRIRLWSLAEEGKSELDSYLVAQSANDVLYGGGSMHFHSCICDGTKVVFTEEIPTVMPVKDRPKAGPDPPAPGHFDAITDLCLCKASQCYLVSSCRSGIIKVWK